MFCSVCCIWIQPYCLEKEPRLCLSSPVEEVTKAQKWGGWHLPAKKLSAWSFPASLSVHHLHHLLSLSMGGLNDKCVIWASMGESSAVACWAPAMAAIGLTFSHRSINRVKGKLGKICGRQNVRARRDSLRKPEEGAEECPRTRRILKYFKLSNKT